MSSFPIFKLPYLASHLMIQLMGAMEVLFCLKGHELYFPSNDPIRDCYSILQNLLSIFRATQVEYTFQLDTLNLENDMFLPALASRYDKFTVVGEHISAETMNFLMDNMKKEASLKVCGILPDKYEHDKMFKFASVLYTKADWMTINKLKEFRDVNQVILESTDLNFEDRNQFLHIWKSCEWDMIRWLKIKFPVETFLDVQTTLSGLIVLNILTSPAPVFMIMIDDIPGREFPLGFVRFHREYNTIELRTMPVMQPFEKTVSVFKLLKRREELKSENRDLEIKQDNVSFLSPSQRKRNNEMKLKSIDKELERLGFRYFKDSP